MKNGRKMPVKGHLAARKSPSPNATVSPIDSDTKEGCYLGREPPIMEVFCKIHEIEPVAQLAQGKMAARRPGRDTLRPGNYRCQMLRYPLHIITRKRGLFRLKTTC